MTTRMLSPSPPRDLHPFMDSGSRPQRYTLCLTLRCNLACSYCYVTKSPITMSLSTARRALDFIYSHAPPNGSIEIGFFGGEPLLEFPLLADVTDLIENHPSYDPTRVSLTLTTNGTIFSDAIADFLNRKKFKFCVSCDGPAHIQDLHRRTVTGEQTSLAVERTLLNAQRALPCVLVNAVYHPHTFRALPETLDYLSGLGLRQIFFNPDYSALWTRQDVEELATVYHAVAERYIDWYLNNKPHFVSLIDTKIALLMRGGYDPLERCQMGTGELAISPDGGVYPCERLIGSGASGEDTHRIGSIEHGVNLSRLSCRHAPDGPMNPQCLECALENLCMRWCGCSNAFMTGYYNRVGPFLCASERAAINTALHVFTTLERQLGPVFLHHLTGDPKWNSDFEKKGEAK